MEEKHIAAIDLGSGKTALTIAKISGENIQIEYHKSFPTSGIRNSGIFNPLQVATCLKKAIEDAEKELNITIHQAALGLPRYYIKQLDAFGKNHRNIPNKGIDKEEVQYLKSSAIEDYPLEEPEKDSIYSAIAQSFSTEDCINQKENDIIGMPGASLEAYFKIFLGSKRHELNIDTMMNEVNIAIAKKYFIPEIAANAILSEEEQENGAALIDFGAGVTSVSIYKHKLLRYHSAIPFGGKSITADIKNECTISEHLAENIKLAYGACMPEKLLNLNDKILQIENETGVPAYQLPVKYLSEIITSRVKEIIDAILYLIQESGYADTLRSGIILTGGGANLTNFSNYVAALSGYNVRTGFPRRLVSAPQHRQIFDTSAATSVSLILAAAKDGLQNCISPNSEAKQQEIPQAKVEETSQPTLIDPEEFGPEVKKEKAKKESKKPKKGNILWKVSEAISGLYESMGKEDI